MWIPPGFAHGYVVVSEAGADVEYKIAGDYAPRHERSIRWDDPDLAIAWPIRGAPILSARDEAAVPFARAETYE
jgi:dTDP-4-dehydrorhamnose 3,5-epimerase